MTSSSEAAQPARKRQSCFSLPAHAVCLEIMHAPCVENYIYPSLRHSCDGHPRQFRPAQSLSQSILRDVVFSTLVVRRALLSAWLCLFFKVNKRHHHPFATANVSRPGLRTAAAPPAPPRVSFPSPYFPSVLSPVFLAVLSL
jgi:hypothetical protein